MPEDWLSTAQLFGYAAFVLGVMSFAQSNDRRFKLFMTAECVAYVVHFSLLGVPAAAASSLVSMIRSLLSLYTRSLWVVTVIVTVNIMLGIGLAEAWWNWFPLLASTIGTLALFLLTGIRMRVVMLAGTLLWLANNVLCGSLGGAVLELVIALTNARTIYKMRSDRKS